MGLLDAMFGAGAEDPRSVGMEGLIAGLLSRNAAGGLLAGSQGIRQARKQQADDARKQQLFDMQLEQHRMTLDEARKAQAQRGLLEDAARQSYLSPLQAEARSMGPTMDGGTVPQVQPGFNAQAYTQRLYGIDPMKAIAFEQANAKDNSPLTVAPGASLVDRKTFKPVFTAPKEQSLPAAIQEYQFAQGQGYKGTFEQWDRERKKAGATNVSVAVGAEKNLLNDIAGGLGKSMVDAQGSARAALNTISTVNRLNDALDSGKVMAGPGTTFRQTGLQIGQMLGVSGKDAGEMLVNTRQAIQSLAQLELDAAQQMKGQGQITEAERGIIRRAASGDIDSMTAPELRLLGGVLDRTARTKIRGYNQQVSPLMKNPNAAPLQPFLQVEEPPERKASGVRRYNPQTGRIE